MKTDVVALARRLCDIPSVTGNEGAIVNEVEQVLQEFGFDVERQPVGTIAGRDNLFAWPKGAAQGVQVLLSTHLDTVPPFYPTRLSEDQEWLLGRGVCDAKGIAACMLIAAKELLDVGENRVGLLFVLGEETTSDGAKTTAALGRPKAKYIINGEPTDLKLATGMKGALVFDLHTEGVPGHSAYPHTGHSAVHQLCQDMAAILNHPWPVTADFGPTTVNIGEMKGGVAPNVIAEKAHARCVMRTTTDVETLEADLRKLLTSTGDKPTQIEIRSAYSPDKLEAIEGFDTCVVAFGSDVPHLKGLATPLLIGPGSILDAHTDHERIKIADLEEAIRVYKRLCLALVERDR